LPRATGRSADDAGSMAARALLRDIDYRVSNNRRFPSRGEGGSIARSLEDPEGATIETRVIERSASFSHRARILRLASAFSFARLPPSPRPLFPRDATTRFATAGNSDL